MDHLAAHTLSQSPYTPENFAPHFWGFDFKKRIRNTICEICVIPRTCLPVGRSVILTKNMRLLPGKRAEIRYQATLAKKALLDFGLHLLTL